MIQLFPMKCIANALCVFLSIQKHSGEERRQGEGKRGERIE